tara:strand:+ start:5041 stop:5592 length:552 start_codon:yes stop_codon:yes gene_type:complete
MPNKPKTLRTGPPVLFDPAAEAAQSLRFDPVPPSESRDYQERMERDRRSAEREQGLPQTEAEIEEYNRKVRLWNQQNPDAKYKKFEIRIPRRLGTVNPGQTPEQMSQAQREAYGEMDAERADEIERLRNAIEIGKQGLQRNPNNAELLRRVKEGEKRLEELQSQGMNQTLQEAMPINPGQTIR